MQCREAVFAEDVLIYVVDNYRGEGYVREVYNPDCYIRLDDRQAIIYQQVQNVMVRRYKNMVFQQFQTSLV